MIFVGAAFGGPPDILCYCKDCQRQSPTKLCLIIRTFTLCGQVLRKSTEKSDLFEQEEKYSSFTDIIAACSRNDSGFGDTARKRDNFS